MGQVIDLKEYKEKQFRQAMNEAYRTASIDAIEGLYDKIDLLQKVYLDPAQLYTKLKVIENFIDMEVTRDLQQAQLSQQKGDNVDDRN